PTQEPDFAALDAAVLADDYNAFRAAAAPYDGALRKRAGRWVERVPEVQAKIGHGLDIADVVEAVFLDAFAAHTPRPRAGRFGDWLDHLTDAAGKSLRDGGYYLDKARLAHTAREAQERPTNN